jgi:hypothetical protein
VTLNADAREGLELVKRAERIFSAEEAAPAEGALARELDLRRRFQEGYAFFREREPAAIEALDGRIARYEKALEAAGGLDPKTLRSGYPAGAVASYALLRLAQILIVLPLAALGAAVHWPAYRLAGVLAHRIAKGEDAMVGTVKILASMLFFPLTWAAVALAVGRAHGAQAGLMAGCLAPALGWLALRFAEVVDSTFGAARAFFYYVARPRFFARLLAERRAIRDEILGLAAKLDQARGAASTMGAS